MECLGQQKNAHTNKCQIETARAYTDVYEFGEAGMCMTISDERLLKLFFRAVTIFVTFIFFVMLISPAVIISRTAALVGVIGGIITERVINALP